MLPTVVFAAMGALSLLAGHAHCDESWDSGNAELERAARMGNTVVFHTLNDGLARDLCSTNNTDWRGTLPRYLAGALDGTSVLVWNGLAYLSHEPRDCRLCLPDLGRSGEHIGPFSCDGFFKYRKTIDGQHAANAVVHIGSYLSSVKRCESCDLSLMPSEEGNFEAMLHLSLGQSWIARDTRRIHLPISNSNPVNQGRVVRMDSVVHDNAYLKPQAGQRPLICEDETMPPASRSELLYIARFASVKGQEDFLKLASPSLLQGHKVVFFAGKNDAGAQRVSSRLESIANSRNISIEVNLDKIARSELERRSCNARGMVLYASSDRNPRVVYEALYAGLPLFITASSRAPDLLLQQPFAVTPQFVSADDASDQQVKEFNKSLKKFLRKSGRDGIRQSTTVFVKRYMSPEKVYRNLAKKMGLI